MYLRVNVLWWWWIATFLFGGPALTLAAAPCAPATTATSWTPPRVRAGDVEIGFDELPGALGGSRAVLIGERHDRLDHHLNQLEIVCALARRDGPLAIGFEAFEQSFQPVLDDYTAGRIDEAALLARSEYFSRWRFDFRLYAPLVRFAREQGLAMVALNVPSELVAKVGREGFAGLKPGERLRLAPTSGEADEAYRARLRAVFDTHAMAETEATDEAFERFVQAQLAWDEGMAHNASHFLKANPQARLAVIAGAGHVAYGSGIPSRLARASGLEVTTIIQGDEQWPSPDAADFRLFHPDPVTLPPAGRLGVRLDDTNGAPQVISFGESSAAKDAGIAIGDRVVGIGPQAINSYAELRIAMVDMAPGERLEVRVAREREPLSFDITLR